MSESNEYTWDVEIINPSLASNQNWSKYEFKAAASYVNQEIVDVTLDVTYDELGHDIILRSSIKIREPDVYLLQVWLQNKWLGIGIPEDLPWIESICDFDSSQRISSATCGLVDSKWNPSEDSGKKYAALVWGWVEKQGKPLQFGPVEHKYVYP